MNTGSPAPTGNNASLSQQESPFEYSAIVASPLVNGEAKLALSEGALLVTALFDAVEIPFAEINELRFENYTVFIESDSGAYAFSRMGQWAQPFYDALYDSYNKAVLRSLFIKGEPLVTAQGEYRYAEGASTASGKAPFYVYENCLALLPPNLAARRIPLCFVRALDKEDFSLTLSLDTQERYSFSKLGYDTAPFANAVEKQLRALHQKALAAVKELDASLAAAQATQIAKLTLEGTAAPLGRLAALAPSFVTALEHEIAKTRAAEYYAALKELCEPAGIWVGFRKQDTAGPSGSIGEVAALLQGGESSPLAALGGTEGNPLAALGGLASAFAGEEGGEAKKTAPDAYAFFFIAPSPDGTYATVEFSEADSATFVYRTNGDVENFARQLNRALEAISFKREVIRLSDEELRDPKNADYAMAAKRTTALQFVRAQFAGRVIHSSPEAWRQSLLALWR